MLNSYNKILGSIMINDVQTRGRGLCQIQKWTGEGVEDKCQIEENVYVLNFFYLLIIIYK